MKFLNQLKKKINSKLQTQKTPHSIQISLMKLKLLLKRKMMRIPQEKVEKMLITAMLIVQLGKILMLVVKLKTLVRLMNS